MLYRFQSPAGADVILLEAAGKQMLQLLGRAPEARGIIQLEDLASAMASLEQAVLDDEARHAEQVAEAHSRGETPPRREGVTLRQRAWPLLELMRHSQKARKDLTWNA